MFGVDLEGLDQGGKNYGWLSNKHMSLMVALNKYIKYYYLSTSEVNGKKYEVLLYHEKYTGLRIVKDMFKRSLCVFSCLGITNDSIYISM